MRCTKVYQYIWGGGNVAVHFNRSLCGRSQVIYTKVSSAMKCHQGVGVAMPIYHLVCGLQEFNIVLNTKGGWPQIVDCD